MREVLLTIALLATLKYLFEEGVHSSLLVRCLHAAVYAAFIALVHGLTQHVSRMEVETLLYSPEALRNVSLAVMVDLLYVVYICTHRPSSFRLYRTWVRHLPPLLFFPTLFYLRLSLFYVLPGYSFVGVSIVMALIVAALSITAPYLWRALGLKREVLREPLVLLSLCTFVFVIAAGVLHPDSAVRTAGITTDWWQALYLFLIVLAGASIGYFAPRLWAIIRRKNNRKK
ncbi:hypothetical protein [Porphyromonas gingivalis]|uniref:hypothetical protein n=2 Tax=Porphyromonas gingivalis TaxID=837 RepID=UPI0024DF8DFD|nr:hypothetical protein [Porphyromonas gingivalis]WIM91902.1 hypothetical protein QP877_02465 [Porphyromonas gingivalis]